MLKKISLLSGDEKSRVMLGKLIAKDEIEAKILDIMQKKWMI